jgi:hypothetical protein
LSPITKKALDKDSIRDKPANPDNSREINANISKAIWKQLVVKTEVCTENPKIEKTSASK